MKPPIIFISGPTAIGKSQFAIDLAKKNNGQIINADSMQVYKDLEILTARPTKKEKKNITHHLYGHILCSHRYSVAQWCKEIIPIIKKNDEKKIQSIVVGGSGLYINTLLNGIASIPDVPEEYKNKSNKLLTEIGKKKFYSIIHKIDKESCERISINDSQRLKRIWEVYYSTGKKLSEWIKVNQNNLIENYNFQVLLFFPAREEIYENVNNRFLKMIKLGAVEEVKKLLSMNLDPSLPIMKAHGVPEISQYLSGSISFDECISRGQQVTRNYVKRQFTWWKSSKIENCSIFSNFPSKININSLDFFKNIN